MSEQLHALKCDTGPDEEGSIAHREMGLELNDLIHKHKELQARFNEPYKEIAMLERSPENTAYIQNIYGPPSALVNSRFQLYVQAIPHISLRIAKGEAADILLYHTSMTRDSDGDYDHMGICVYVEAIEACVEKSKDCLHSFAYNICNVIFKHDGAKYFSIAGSNRTKRTLETLVLPSEYALGFVCLVESVAKNYKLHIPKRYGKVSHKNKSQLRQKCGKNALTMWLTKLRKNIGPKVNKC